MHRGLLRNVLSLTAADLLARLASAALVAIAARALGVEGYGLYATALAWLFFARLASRVGLQGVVVVRDVAERPELAPGYLASATVLSLATTIVVAVLLPAIARGLGYRAELAPLLVPVGVALMGSALARPADEILRALEAMRGLAVAGTLLAAGTAATGLLTLALGGGAQALLWVQATSAWVEAACLLGLVARQRVPLGALPSLGTVRRLLVEGVWVFLLTLGDLVATRSDVLLLARLGPPESVGLYVPGLRILEYLTFFRAGALGALFPFLAARMSEAPGAVGRAFGEVRRLLAVYAVGLAVAVSFGAEHILSLVLGSAYTGGAMAFRILAWAMVCEALTGPFAEIVFLLRRPLLPFLPFVVGGAALNVGLNIWLIPGHAQLGSATAALVTAVAALVFRAYWTRGLLGPGRPTLREAAWRPLVAGGASAAVFAVLRPLGFWPTLPLGLLAYLAVVAALGGFRPAEIAWARGLLHAFRST